MRLEQTMDRHRDIFHRWDQLTEFRKFHVQVLVIEAVENRRRNNALEIGDVDQQSIGIGLAEERDLQLVVVAVAVRVVALAEDMSVLFFGGPGTVQAMGGRKLKLLAKSDHGSLRGTDGIGKERA